MISLSNPQVNKEDIKVSEENIFTHFFGCINHIPCLINSPFRKDKNPSFSIFYNKQGKLRFKDFATQECWDIYSLLQKYLNCSYEEVLQRIIKECKGLSYNNKIKVNYGSKISLEDIEINVSVRDFKNYDYEFWDKYGINKEWLKFGQVYAISNIFIKKKDREIVVPAEKYAYAYAEFKDKKTTFKIYQPYSKKFKWMNNHNKSVWDLWRQLPAIGDKLIITSSRKDALCLWANLGIPSTCLQGEGYYPKDKIMNQVKQRFDKIYVLLDNDETGKKFGHSISEKFDLIYLEIEASYEVKDPSDFYKKYGKEKFINYFKKLCI